jgi:hypothetical protein
LYRRQCYINSISDGLLNYSLTLEPYSFPPKVYIQSGSRTTNNDLFPSFFPLIVPIQTAFIKITPSYQHDPEWQAPLPLSQPRTCPHI